MTELARGEKESRPSPRCGVTWEVEVGGQKIFLRTGEFLDGRLCEIFIDIPDQASFLQNALNGFCINFSLALQYGMPLKRLVDSFIKTRFEPCGPVRGDPEIKFASSLFNYIVRRAWLNYGTGDMTKYANIMPDVPAMKAVDPSPPIPATDRDPDDKSWDTKPVGYISKGSGA